MQVDLVDYQLSALEMLIYTKNTRLRSEFPTIESIVAMSLDWKLEQLEYIKDTIQSSWEFIDYIFEIKGVSRNFTHQLVRTRTASFAQEAQRVVDLNEAAFFVPKTIAANPWSDAAYNSACANAVSTYAMLTREGIPRQDARNVIPTGVLTNIMIKANLRTLHNMAELRLCFRVQDEYQRVFKEMKRHVVEVHPWFEPFIQVFCVNHAHCAFPRYTECPIQKYTIHGDTFRYYQHEIKRRHAETEHEAQPIANKDGMTM